MQPLTTRELVHFLPGDVMPKGLIASGLLFVLLMCAPPGQTQSEARSETIQDQNEITPVQGTADVDGWRRPIAPPKNGRKSAPAPRHDISGTWDLANGALDGLGPVGAKAMPEDGKPEHQPSYTAMGLEMLNRAKPTFGQRGVSSAETNDPALICDPLGMPSEELFQLRTTQIVQTPNKVLILYEYNRVWRVIWTDGRELPKNPEPRWYGYSVGKWADDYTLVAQTSGMDERTWIDHAGRPHSGDLRVEERFHRADRDHLDLSITISDPITYTKPWVALNKLPFYLQPPSFDVREMICSPSEVSEYNKLLGDPASEKSR